MRAVGGLGGRDFAAASRAPMPSARGVSPPRAFPSNSPARFPLAGARHGQGIVVRLLPQTSIVGTNRRKRDPRTTPRRACARQSRVARRGAMRNAGALAGHRAPRRPRLREGASEEASRLVESHRGLGNEARRVVPTPPRRGTLCPERERIEPRSRVAGRSSSPDRPLWRIGAPITRPTRPRSTLSAFAPRRATPQQRTRASFVAVTVEDP